MREREISCVERAAINDPIPVPALSDDHAQIIDAFTVDLALLLLVHVKRAPEGVATGRLIEHARQLVPLMVEALITHKDPPQAVGG